MAWWLTKVIFGSKGTDFFAVFAGMREILVLEMLALWWFEVRVSIRFAVWQTNTDCDPPKKSVLRIVQWKWMLVKPDTPVIEYGHVHSRVLKYVL